MSIFKDLTIVPKKETYIYTKIKNILPAVFFSEIVISGTVIFSQILYIIISTSLCMVTF